jgi:SPP1 family predicted phage head-tail adaptor
MYNEVISLVTVEETSNEVGDLVKTRTEKDVFVELKSIGQTEFYQAKALGLKPEIKFILADYYDYNDEKLIIYNGKDYTVLRTYRNNNELEIVCQGDVNVST